MTRSLPAAAAVMLLAACGDPAAPPQPTPSPSATRDVLATVAALPPRQRDGVLFRAIRDSGRECQAISDVRPQPTEDATLAWLALCDGREQWLVQMNRAGVATVIGAKEAAAAAR
jgi:hypothetical protein